MPDLTIKLNDSFEFSEPGIVMQMGSPEATSHHWAVPGMTNRVPDRGLDLVPIICRTGDLYFPSS
jgi:hypothetical protein